MYGIYRCGRRGVRLCEGDLVGELYHVDNCNDRHSEWTTKANHKRRVKQQIRIAGEARAGQGSGETRRSLNQRKTRRTVLTITFTPYPPEKVDHYAYFVGRHSELRTPSETRISIESFINSTCSHIVSRAVYQPIHLEGTLYPTDCANAHQRHSRGPCPEVRPPPSLDPSSIFP